MPTLGKDRIRSFRERQAKQGKTRLSVALDPESRKALDTLRSSHTDLSIDRIINDLLTGKITLPCNNKPLSSNKQPVLPRNNRTLPCNEKPLSSNRAELAKQGHQFRKEGKTLEAIAEQFNREGWTPDRIPKDQGIKPRSDSAKNWTVKAVSQLLTRDYPEDSKNRLSSKA